MESSLLGYGLGSRSDCFLQAVNPATGKTLPERYAAASEDEIKRACEMAEAVRFELAALSGSEKGAFLRTLSQALEEALEELVTLMTAETALPETRVRAETARSCGQLRMFADLVEGGDWVDARIDRARPDRQPLPKPDLRSMLRPIGPVAVFCAGNFPLAFSVAGGDSAAAWAAGCPVVVKAHSSHPGTALLVGRKVVESLKECGWPEGSFSLLFGRGKLIGQSLVSHPAIKAVAFTGSRQAGRSIMELAAKRPEPIPVFAEMSSVNPIFVLSGINSTKIEAFAEGLSTSATLGVGQFCTNPGIVFHPGGQWGEEFISHYSGKMAKVAPAPMLNRGICESYEKGLDFLANLQGVEVVRRVFAGTDQDCCKAGVCVLKAKAKDFLDNSSMMEEVFGPATLLVSYESFDQLISIAARMEGQLTSSIFGEEDDLEKCDSLLRILEGKAGRLIFNQFPTGVEVCDSVVHGGPFPATSDSRSTSVGTGAILRFARPVCYQGFPEKTLPHELKDANPLSLRRKEN